MFVLLKKILGALNSAQSSWQISLAIIFAIFTGFAPLYVPFNLLFLFIVFTLNIPIGIYFALSALFATFGYLLDPLFDEVGYYLLTLKSLEPMWTALYSNTIAIWTNFNHSTTLGSLVVSFVISVPLFFILNKLIDKYRIFLERKFSQSKYFGWLNPYSEKKLSKKPGVIRWWGSGLFVGVTALTTLFVFLFLDPILKKTIEFTLSKLTSSEVHISTLTTSFKDLTFDIENLKFIKNDKDSKNLLIERINAKLDYDHLVQKKIDITQINLTNIRPNQKVTVTKQELDEAGFDDVKIELPKIEMPNIDLLIQSEDLESKKGLASINEKNDTITKRWDEFSKKGFAKEQTKAIDLKIKEIEKAISKIKSPKDIEKINKSVEEINKEIASINDDIASYKKAYDEDMKTINENIKQLTELPSKDYNNLLNKYQLNAVGAINFVETYIGPSLASYMKDGLKYYEMAKPYISSDDESEEEVVVKRNEGRWVIFVRVDPYPEFTMRNIKGNIITNSNQNYGLSISNITDDQKLLNKPITAQITGKDNFYKDLTVDIIHNNLSTKAITNINFKLSEFKKSQYKFSNEFSLNDSHVNSIGNLKIEEFKNLKGSYDIDIFKTSMLWAKNDTKLDTILVDVFKGVNKFDINGKIGGELLKPNISLVSDLDKQINASMKNVLDKEVEAYKKELKLKLDNLVKSELKKLNISSEQMAEVDKLLANKDGELTKFKDKIAKDFNTQKLTKDLEDQVNKEIEKQKQALDAKVKAEEAKAKAAADKKKKELEKKAADKLKNIIKF